MGIRLKDLSKLGYRDNVARSLVVDIVSKHCKYDTKEQIEMTLSDILEHPESYKNNEIWNKLAERLSPTIIAKEFIAYDLLDEPLMYKTYGGKFIETLAKQQMNLAMRLPVTVAGALMPDAHAGYGLPIGGVLATDNVVIPYAVGVDIGCRMSLTVFDASADFLKRYTYQMKEALKDFTHFGMDGGLGFEQEHEVLDREEFRLTPLLRDLHGKAVRQLGSSGGGNHFVEFGEIALQENNVLNLPEGNYLALLSHSGSRGLGAAIAKYYSLLAREVCRLPREAQHFAWLDLNTEAGQEYWMSMNLAGLLAEKDDYLDVFVSDMKYSDQPITRNISEDLADIYQDIRDFIFVFQLGLNETMNDSLAVCRENFALYWGQKLVNTLRALHDVKYNQPEDEEENQDEEDE